MMTMLSPEPPYSLSGGRKRKGTASTATRAMPPFAAPIHPWAWPCSKCGSPVGIGRHEHHVGGCDDGALRSLGPRGARVELVDAENFASCAKMVLGDLAEVGRAVDLPGDRIEMRAALGRRKRKAFGAQRHPHRRPRIHG